MAVATLMPRRGCKGRVDAVRNGMNGSRSEKGDIEDKDWEVKRRW